ncbi:ADP-ribosyltransferase, partial [Streptomyces kebangsaanensis]
DKLPSWVRDSRTAMKETGKALVAWDEWGKNPARAAGAVTFNVLTTVFTGGAGGAAAGAGKAGAAAKVLSAAGKAGRALDPMTYVAKGAGAGLSKVGDISKALKGVGTIDIPKLPDGSVHLPDGRFLDPHGNIMTPNGVIDTTPIPHETAAPKLPDHWTIQGQQPVYAGAHTGDGLAGSAHTTDAVGRYDTATHTSYDHASAGAPTHDVPSGAPHTPHTGGHDVPGSGGHAPDPAHHGPAHGTSAGHADDAAHGAGHTDDGGHHPDHTAGHADDAVHMGDHADLGHTAVDTAAHHGADAPAAPGHPGTDVPGNGGGEPFEYKPHMSKAEFAVLSDAEKHAVATAELAHGTNPVPSVSNEAGLKYGNTYWNDFLDDLHPESRSALVTYTGSAYTSINGHLRFGEHASEYTLHTIDEMDKVMGARPVPEDVMIVRGTGIDHLDLKSPMDMQGGVFDDKAYTSTALGKTPPPPFDGKPVWMHLRVPKGTPALWLDHLSQVPGERELLLARGTEYKVTRVFMDEADGKWHVYGEVLPRP